MIRYFRNSNGAKANRVSSSILHDRGMTWVSSCKSNAASYRIFRPGMNPQPWGLLSARALAVTITLAQHMFLASLGSLIIHFFLQSELRFGFVTGIIVSTISPTL